MRPGRLFPLIGLPVAAGVALAAVAAGPPEDPRPRHSWEPAEHVVGRLAPGDVAARLPAWEEHVRTFVPAPEVVARMRVSAPAIIEVVFGTWCSDSYEHLPPLLAAWRAAANPGLELVLVGVDRGKRDPEGIAERLRVERVPTIVVTRDGRELGRIVETPATTMDRDVALLLGAVLMDGPTTRDDLPRDPER